MSVDDGTAMVRPRSNQRQAPLLTPSAEALISMPWSLRHSQTGRNDLLIARENQECCASKRRKGVCTDNTTQRGRTITCLNDGRDDALAHTGGAPPFVHHQNAFGRLCLLGDESLIQWLQPAQIDDPHAPAELLFPCSLGAQTHRHWARRHIGTALPNVKTTRSSPEPPSSGA